ncbi:unnamed protein product [Cyclocybe aegerita]|uniref:Uncharacterized protein n=1 Tax=Cyclocybe aegerita TaxID=1973307 RepID=A0A8S0W9F8_CYCAE|nr:unnamed protein product [Cyclocybe aegerita]
MAWELTGPEFEHSFYVGNYMSAVLYGRENVDHTPRCLRWCPSLYMAEVSVWYQTMGSTSVVAMVLLGDALMLYRLFVIYGSRYCVIALPILMYFAAFALAILELVLAANPGRDFFHGNNINFGTPYFSLVIALNLIITVLICAHSARTYTGIASMLIESAAPYSLVGILFLTFYAVGSMTAISSAFGQVWAKLACTSPQLIALRVVTGRAWGREVITQAQSSLNFEMRSTSGAVVVDPGDTHIFINASTSLVARPKLASLPRHHIASAFAQIPLVNKMDSPTPFLSDEAIGAMSEDEMRQTLGKMREEIARLSLERATLLKKIERKQRKLEEIDDLEDTSSNPSSGDDEETQIDYESVMKHDLATLKMEGWKTRDILTDGDHKAQPSTFTPELPPEIWYSIFERAIPPNWLLDPSLSLGYDSSCVALPFLYEDICIRRVHQFLTLVGTIRNSPYKYGGLVKALNILCYVPEVFLNQFTKYLTTLFFLCPRLEKFACTSLIPLPQQAVIPMPPQSVSRLQLSSVASWETIKSLLNETRTTLTSLWLQMPETVPELVPDSPISLSRLSSLVLECKLNPGNRRGHDINFLRRQFDFPGLSKITLCQLTVGGMDEGVGDAVIAFLERHGARLVFLNLHPSFSLRLQDTFFYRLLHLKKISPHLERFLMPLSFVAKNKAWLEHFSHPKLQWLDFCHPPNAIPDTGGLSNISLLHGDLPGLRGSRVLSCLPHVSYEWLQIFPPEAVRTPDESFAINFYPSQLIHAVNYIYWLRPQWDAGRSGWRCDDQFASSFRDGEWPCVEQLLKKGSLDLSASYPRESDKNESDSEDGAYVPVSDDSESEDDLASEVETESDISKEDWAELLSGSTGF